MSSIHVPVVQIDPSIAAHLVPLTDEEFALLEENILEDGCREPLVLWGDVLIDGHNRYRICTKHGLEFDTFQRDFADREAVEDWIDANQLGRRNLSPDAASLLRGRRYERAKKAEGGSGANQHSEEPPQTEAVPRRTSERLAQQHGVSRATIERDGQFARAVETLRPHIPDIEQRVLSGDIPSKAAVVEAAKEPERAPEILANKMAVHYSSDSPEWYTPKSVIAATLALLGEIDLDPCSNDRVSPNVPARKHFVAIDNGLVQTWNGRVYMNPPYGDEIGQWTSKLLAEYVRGSVTEAVALVPSRTDTRWFRELRECPRCFVSGRLKFSESASSAPFPSVVVYFGKRTAEFAKAFAVLGDTYTLHR